MRVRPLRGQVVVRELPRERSSTLWTPDPTARQIHTHRGKVLGLGPPRLKGDVEVPHGFDVGDVVQYHFTVHEEASTRPWPVDGEPATWIPVDNIDAVLEP
jgi:co-chaperonin GroES (HSP10)